ncbi:uncharacterized protein LOC142240048 [Haematobia irritans]|uniref:uncharacterized protein LOC142240048 n=1 Tax=Haematobia irritans TaxID=7368 RepID=UPI003F509808
MSKEGMSVLEETTGTPGNSSNLIHVKVLHRDNIMKQVLNEASNLAEYNNLTIHQLEVKLSLLERRLEAFESAQDAYFKIKSCILERMSNLRLNITEPSMCSTRVLTSSPQQPQRPSLPPLQLSKFNGDYTTWSDFYNMFLVLVHENSDLSVISKFQYLRSCLTDEAARLIQALEMTPQNYEEALQILKLRYDNKRFIFQSHIEKIFSIKQLRNPSAHEVRDFMDYTNANIRALQTIASREQISNGILLHMIVSKLDADTQSKWEEEIFTNWDNGETNDELVLPELKDLSLFLERRCKSLDLMSSNEIKHRQFHMKPPNNNSFQAKKKSASSFVVSNAPTQCCFCKSPTPHNPFNCRKFIEMKDTERFRMVKNLKLCLNCLGTNHFASKCPSTNRCQLCNNTHHTLLHKQQSSSPSLPQPSTLLPPLPSQPTPSITPPESTAATSLHLSDIDSTVILGTAQVELKSSKGRSIIVRALLDSGSQLHFVTEHIAQYLRVPRTKISMEVNGIAHNSIGAFNTCSFAVTSLYSDYSSSITATIIPSITSYQPQNALDIKQWRIPGNVKLADNSFYLPGPIDLLIGAELFYELLLVGQIKNGNTPTLQKTRLGWIVVGSSLQQKQEQRTLNNTAQPAVSSALLATTSNQNSPQSCATI